MEAIEGDQVTQKDAEEKTAAACETYGQPIEKLRGIWEHTVSRLIGCRGVDGYPIDGHAVSVPFPRLCHQCGKGIDSGWVCTTCAWSPERAVRRLICRIRGHRLRFAEFDPITITHALRCGRCGLHAWPELDRPPVDVSGKGL